MWQQLAGKIWRKMPNWGRRSIIRLTQPSFTVSAAVIIFNNENLVLLLNHVLRPASGWGVPGGFLESGEQPEQTARREIFEETGLEIFDLEFVTINTTAHHIEILYLARTDRSDVVLKGREIIEARWFNLGNLPPELNRWQRQTIEKVIKAREK